MEIKSGSVSGGVKLSDQTAFTYQAVEGAAGGGIFS
jgi:hypothetical protein